MKWYKRQILEFLLLSDSISYGYSAGKLQLPFVSLPNDAVFQS